MNLIEAYEAIEELLNRGELVATTTDGVPLFNLHMDDVCHKINAVHMGFGAFRGFISHANMPIEVSFYGNGAMQRVEDAHELWTWSFTGVHFEEAYKDAVCEKLGVTPEWQLERLKVLRGNLPDGI